MPAADVSGDPDLFISVDCPVTERLADSAQVLARARTVACFDHHPAREEFADATVRCVNAAATAVLIEDFLSWAGIELTGEIATCLLCGLVTDTGRFQYQNADPAAFACAARLVDAGAEPSRISLEVYQSQRLGYLKLESLVMSRIHTVADGKVAYSYAYASDLTGYGVTSDECDGLVDVVRAVRGVEVCLFVKETECCHRCARQPALQVRSGRLRRCRRLRWRRARRRCGIHLRGQHRRDAERCAAMLCELVGVDAEGIHVEL